MREDSILENILNQLRHLSLQDLLILQGAVNVLVLVLTDKANEHK